ncbi:hypothetical protein [Rhodococcus qingshengii]|uniref:ATP dependent DNA ligase n=1 Tax=Rhodococcus qingshengii TaxID=334542 RepID=UPI0022B3568F|nr:hypothetical protein [Rhodococcus qingshengii]MCZ4618400.1 hypothetical protein [Rhodococcus qingshengii]
MLVSHRCRLLLVHVYCVRCNIEPRRPDQQGAIHSRCPSKRPGFAREKPRIVCIRCNSTGFSGSLVYIGNVGTGFSARQRRKLREQLIEIERPTSPFAIAPPRAITREARWSEPLLACDVEYIPSTGFHGRQLAAPLLFAGCATTRPPM